MESGDEIIPPVVALEVPPVAVDVPVRDAEMALTYGPRMSSLFPLDARPQPSYPFSVGELVRVEQLSCSPELQLEPLVSPPVLTIENEIREAPILPFVPSELVAEPPLPKIVPFNLEEALRKTKQKMGGSMVMNRYAEIKASYRYNYRTKNKDRGVTEKEYATAMDIYESIRTDLEEMIKNGVCQDIMKECIVSFQRDQNRFLFPPSDAIAQACEAFAQFCENPCVEKYYGEYFPFVLLKEKLRDEVLRYQDGLFMESHNREETRGPLGLLLQNVGIFLAIQLSMSLIKYFNSSSDDSEKAIQSQQPPPPPHAPPRAAFQHQRPIVREVPPELLKEFNHSFTP
jgi:hypothetical protein